MWQCLCGGLQRNVDIHTAGGHRSVKSGILADNEHGRDGDWDADTGDRYRQLASATAVLRCLKRTRIRACRGSKTMARTTLHRIGPRYGQTTRAKPRVTRARSRTVQRCWRVARGTAAMMTSFTAAGLKV